MFPLICAWINVWVNNRKTGDLRRHRALYDVTDWKWQLSVWNISRKWFMNHRVGFRNRDVKSAIFLPHFFFLLLPFSLFSLFLIFSLCIYTYIWIYIYIYINLFVPDGSLLIISPAMTGTLLILEKEGHLAHALGLGMPRSLFVCVTIGPLDLQNSVSGVFNLWAEKYLSFCCGVQMHWKPCGARTRLIGWYHYAQGGALLLTWVNFNPSRDR